MLRLVLRCGELIEREKRVWTIGMLSFKAKSSTQKWKRPFYPKIPQKKKKMWKLAGRNHSLSERRSTERKNEKKKRKSDQRIDSLATIPFLIHCRIPPPPSLSFPERSLPCTLPIPSNCTALDTRDFKMEFTVPLKSRSGTVTRSRTRQSELATSANCRRDAR